MSTRPAPDFQALATQFEALMGIAGGRTLRQARLVEKGMEFEFQDQTERIVIAVLPRVYTEGQVIVDAINDLVLVVRMRRYAVDGGQGEPGALLEEKALELPFSTWYEEGDYR